MAKPVADGRIFAEPARDGSRSDLVWVPMAYPSKPVILVRGVAAPRQVAMLQIERAGEVLHRWPADFPLRFTDDKSVQVRVGYWPAEGLFASVDRLDYNLALETPFAAAAWRDPTLLPRAFLLVGLGKKIVLLDLRTLKLAILAPGDSPAVVLDLAEAPRRESNAERPFDY